MNIHDPPALLADSLIVPEQAPCSVPEPLCHMALPPKRARISRSFSMIPQSWRRRLAPPSNPRRVVRRRFRPVLEVLEDRMAPAVLTVNSTADTAQATDPYLSLREAIAIVNSSTLPTGLSSQIRAQISGTLHAGQSDTIQFDQTKVATPIVLDVNLGQRLYLRLPRNTAAVTIDGGAAGVTVDGNDGIGVFTVNSGVQATFAHLTITRGNADTGSAGGGIYNAGTLTVTNCTLSANHSDYSFSGGGGIYNVGTLTVIGCTFTGNHANNSPWTLPRSSGGGAITNLGTASVSGSIFTGNHADRTGQSGAASAGGAIYNGFNGAGTMTVFGCTFSDNHVDGNFGDGGGCLGGGAIYNNATMAVANCTLGETDDSPANSADRSFAGGGCIYNLGRLTLTSSTLNANHADAVKGGASIGGGAIANGGTLTVTNSTLDGNHDDNSFMGGGAISNMGTLTLITSTLTANHAFGVTGDSFAGGGAINGHDRGTITLVNTIVALNSTDGNGPDIYGPVVGTSHHSLIGNGTAMSGISNGVNGDLVGTAASPIDPGLGPLGPHGGSTETRAAVGGSPALNAGDPALLGSADQRGVMRLGGVNIGAFQASATNFRFFSTASATAGTPFALLVQASDPFGLAAPGYRGPVHFSSNDSQATLPADYTFTAADSSQHTFNVVFRSAGNQTITAGTASIGGVMQFSIPTANSSPSGMTSGPDGNLWFTESDGNKIARMTVAGAVTEFSIPTAGSSPQEIATGSDGNLWFTEFKSNKVGKITPAGAVTEFPIPTGGSLPSGITAGPDGNLWFVERGGNKVGKITPAGAITEFPIPTKGSDPIAITAGPDGNLWFIEDVGNKVGKIAPSGVITEFSIPTSFSYPSAITAGPDGSLWFTEGTVKKVGKITPTGAITEFPIPSGGPGRITTGPDGNLWFTEYGANKVGMITPDGAVTEFPSPGGGPYAITAGPDGNLWFVEASGNKVGRISSGAPTGGAAVTVVAAAADHYALIMSAGKDTVTGTPFDVTVTALDPYGNTATDYRGTTHFTSSDPQAVLPADYTFTAADNGVHTFSGVILRSAGSQTITASSGVIGVVTEFSLPAANSRPTAITSGPDGNLWFTEGSGNKIGTITPAGTVTEFPLPTGGSWPRGITAGSDGNVWFVEYFGNKVGKITPTGAITEFPLPTGSGPTGITAGPDGNLWLAEYFGNKVGTITPAGVLTEFPLPTGGSYPIAMAAGPDGNLWFVELSGNKVGTITPAGAVREFPLPIGGSQPYGITGGPDGNLWFAEASGNKVGQITSGAPLGNATITVSGPAAPPGGGASLPVGATPSGELTARDSFFALVNRKEPTTASLADSTVGTDDSKAPVLVFFPTQRSLDGTPMSGQVPAPACNVGGRLLTGNQQEQKGLLEDGNVTLQAPAADLFHALNQAGGI
jgi:streptogramin lyase